MYFGTDTQKGGGKGIYRATFNATTGELTQMGLVVEMEQPSFLALGPNSARPMLYAVGETTDGTINSVCDGAADGGPAKGGAGELGDSGALLRVDRRDGDMRRFRRTTQVAGVSSYRVQADGTLSAPVDQVNYKDAAQYGVNGPNPAARQDGPHPHCVTISPDNRFLVVCDLGHDRISIFEIDGEPGKLDTDEPHLFSNNRPGSGPRHVAFHPNQRWMYARQ